MQNISEIRRKLSGRKLSTVGRHKFFSVLVPLVEMDGEVHVLYEVRSASIPRQPGEVCFPGGAIEEGESSLEAALRETYEETGIPPESVDVIGEGDRLISHVGFTMYSWYGILDRNALNSMKLNPDEVAEVFTVPLSWFMENDPEIHIMDLVQYNRKGFPFEKAQIPENYRWMGGNSEVPIYSFNGRAIWGLTGRITRNMVQILKGEKD